MTSSFEHSLASGGHFILKKQKKLLEGGNTMKRKNSNMTVTDLIPWKNTTGGLATRRPERDAFSQLHREIDRVFSDFMTDWPWAGCMNLLDRRIGSFVPDVDVTETDKEFRLTVELPGMEEKDLEVSYFEGGLTIKGEKREEHQEQRGTSTGQSGNSARSSARFRYLRRLTLTGRRLPSRKGR
jgi:HSP20 family molecular chaperone IbpA